MQKNRVKGIGAVSIPSFAFIGPMASGKNTYSDALRSSMEREFGVKVSRLSFSAKISDIARELFDMSGRDRRLLQQIGQKMKEIDPAVWAKYLIKKVKEEGSQPFIVDGIRSKEELNAFMSALPNFVPIRLECDEKARLEAYRKLYGKRPTYKEINDPTEISIKSIETAISLKNDYTYRTLRRHIDWIIKGIKDGSLLKKARPK